MIGLVINKMSFSDKKNNTVEGINLVLKGENGTYISKVFNQDGSSKLKFYSLPHNIFSTVKVGGVYNFTFRADSDTGFASIDGCKPASLED